MEPVTVEACYKITGGNLQPGKPWLIKALECKLEQPGQPGDETPYFPFCKRDTGLCRFITGLSANNPLRDFTYFGTLRKARNLAQSNCKETSGLGDAPTSNYLQRAARKKARLTSGTPTTVTVELPKVVYAGEEAGPISLKMKAAGDDMRVAPWVHLNAEALTYIRLATLAEGKGKAKPRHKRHGCGGKSKNTNDGTECVALGSDAESHHASESGVDQGAESAEDEDTQEQDPRTPSPGTPAPVEDTPPPLSAPATAAAVACGAASAAHDGHLAAPLSPAAVTGLTGAAASAAAATPSPPHACPRFGNTFMARWLNQ